MMQFCAALGFLFVLCLPITAEPVGSSPEENKAQYPAVAANFNMGKPVREGALLQLADFVKHGDTLLKERLQASYTDLKEQLKQGDSLLKNQMMEGVDQLKEERKEGDDRLKEERKEGDNRLKEELDEDVAWLKGRVQEGQDRMKEDLEEAKKTFTGEMSSLKEALDKLQDRVKSCSVPSSAVTDALKQQVDDVQAELGRSLDLLQTTQSELGATKELLGNTTQKAESTEQELHRTRQELQTAQAEVDSLKAEVEGLQSSHRPAVPGDFHVGEENKAVTDTGSTFTRWGHKSCPDNTSLVYSGVAGGSWYGHTGGAANYLCLVRDPQLDNTALPSYYGYVYGAEYDNVQGQHDQDVVCSVCRAPQATTIMVPATLTCPDGWTSHYKGHLMSGRDGLKGRFEYVCVDEEREHAEGGHADKDGALFYHVVTQCGSLPCPPYVNNLVTTCVVCSQ